MNNARILDVPIGAIRLTSANPRTDGGSEIEGLTASLRYGLAQRPTLVEVEPGIFEVLTGERRVRAGIAAGWSTIPAVVEDPRPRIAAHTQRVSENLHRKDLNPLDEARALKLDWLNANAVAMGLEDQVGAALEHAGTVQSSIAAVSAVITHAGWSPSRPAVTQETYLESRGLGISKAAMRKKLQILNLSAAAEERLEHAGLTEAGMRAFLRLGQTDQTMLLDAIERDPALAKETRTIVQWVLNPKKQRTMRQAIAIARGEVSPVDTASDAVDRDYGPLSGAEPPMMVDAGARSATPSTSQTSQTSQTNMLVDEQRSAELVLPLMETAQALQSQIEALSNIELVHPWDGFARDAIVTMLETIKPLCE